MKVLPEHILSKIDPKDRASLGKAGITQAEATAKYSARVERDMHNQYSSWLSLHQIPCAHCRMDKKSSIAVGWPDFTVTYHGRVLFIEFKVKGNKLSAEQEDCHTKLRRAGNAVQTCYSALEAIEITRSHFDLK